MAYPAKQLMVTEERRRQGIFRKHIVIPTEHGSWSWLLVPFGVGAGVAGSFSGPVVLTLLAGLSAFFMRQPATVWLRARRGKARRADGPIAAGWTAGFALIGLLCVAGLLLAGRALLLWLSIPLLVILVLYLAAARYGRAGLRSLWMEVTGAAALAMMAPAALISAMGSFTGTEGILWGLMATQNVLGALYVRLRIHDTHKRPIDRAAILWSHILGAAAVLAAGLIGALPLLAVLPFLGFLGRATWAFNPPKPVANIKRFGFTEMGIEIASGAWIAACYWL